MSLLDEYKQLQKNSGTQQNSGNKRKSLLQEYVDQNGTSGLNEKYVNTSLKNGGGFGATAAGTYSSSLVDENYISAFFSEANKYLGKAKEDYEGMGYSNASTIYGSNSSALRDLKKRYGAISQYLQQNENSIDKDAYSSFSSTLSSYRDAFDEYQNAFKNAKDFYSQWKTEDDYNDYVARQEDYQEKLSYDTVSAQKELDDLNAQFEEAKRLRNERDRYISGAMADPAKATSAQTRLNSLLKRYGYSDIEEMEKDISGKNQYLTLSKRIQDAEKLRNDALGASDFKEFSEMGASIENPSFEDAENAFVIFGKTYGGADIGNKVTYSRENAVGLAMGEANGTTMKGRSIYRYMTEEEVSIYNYYLAKDGEAKADKYLDSIAEELNYREATGIYDRVLEGNTATEVVFGAMAGLDQAASGFRSLFSNSDDYVPASSTQIAGQLAREDLADAGPNLPEWAGGASLGQLAYDFTSTSANMTPSFLVSALTGSPLLGSITLGASAAGNAYQEKINLGYSKDQARAYARLIGASEMGLQYLLGGISKLGGKVSNNFVNTLISNVDNAFARTALKLGGNMASEFTEEYLQDVLTPWFENLTLYTENDVKLYTPEYLYSGLMGALTAGFMEGPSTVSGEVQTYRTGKTIQKSGFSTERLAKLGQTFSADSVAYRLAGKVDENTGAYTIGRLFNEIGATLTEQNQSEIIKSLERKGVSHDDAVTISETLAAVVEGASITERQAAALEANDVVSKTIMDVIVNPNSTVNQRTQNYNEALMALAQEKANGRKGASKAAAEPQELAGGETAPAEGKSTSDTKAAPERMLEASVDGKTINNKTGEEVKIESIASIQNGEMMLKLDSGETVNARDVSYASEGEALIYETVARMDTNAAAANQLVQAYDPAMSAEVYARGIEEAYRYGMYNIPVSEMMDKGSFSVDLTAVQRNTAYRLGQIFGGKAIAREQATVRKIRTVGKSSTAEGKVHFDGDRNALNARQSASLSVMEKIADALGIQIYVFESEEVDGRRQGANGWFDPKDSSIHIDLYAGQNGEATMLFTAAHELTHFIRKWSPAKFKVLANFLMEQYGKKGVSVDTLVQNQIAKAKKNGRDISYDTAYEEVIADSMETMLSDGKVAEKLALLKAKDKTLWGKIKEFFSDLMAKIQEVYKGMKPNSAEGQYVAEMKDALERIQELFTEGLVDAGENYQSVSTQESSINNTERYSFRNSVTGMANDALLPYDKELAILIENNGNIIVDSFGKLKKIVDIAFDEPSRQVTAYFGIIEENILKKIEQSVPNIPKALGGKLFKEGSKYSIAASMDSIRHLTDEKGMAREDVLDYLDKMADTIIENDSVHFDYYTDSRGNRLKGLRFKKKFTDGTMISFEIISAKKKSLNLQTLFMDSASYQKKKSAKTPLMKNTSAHTPEARVGQTSDANVSQDADTVNNKFSLRNIEPISDADIKKAEKFFGTTSNYNVAGYLMTDGKMLDFSGKHWGDDYSTSRQVDHRDVWEVWENMDRDGVDEMINMIGNGNIRLMPEDGGINLAVMPNEKQMNALRGYINHFRGEIIVDIDQVGGDTIHSFTYNRGTSSSKILADIKAYFETGAVPKKQSSIRDFLYSDRDYSYNALVSKPDMKVTTITGNVPNNRADVIYYAKQNAAKVGKFNPKDGSVSVHVKDIAQDITLGTPGLKHSLDRRLSENAPVVLMAGEILQNSIRINELTPQKAEADASYVLIGAAQSASNDFYIVRSVVNRFSNELTSMDVLYAINAKKESAALYAPRLGASPLSETDSFNENRLRSMRPGFQRPVTDSTISIAELLDYVNAYFPDILPEEVLKHYGHAARPDGKLGKSVLYQDRSNDFEKVNRVLEKENAKLREDVSYLKELLKLQKTVTGGTKFTRSSVEAAAGQLMKYANARGDKAELVKRLNTFYEYIAKGEELTWENVKDAASPVTEWLLENVVTQHKLDDYAVEVLRDIRGMRVYLNEVQKQEAAYKYGSFNEFRRKAMGSIIITDKDSISLDSKWVELSAKYPDLFDANTSDANQPIELMEAFDRLRSMDVGQMEYAYEADMIEQDLMRQVYDSYWNVSTLRTVADVKQKQINALKFHHMNRMQELQESHKENTEKLKREYQEKINRLRKEYRDTVISKQEKMKATYRESRERSVEGRKKTVIRNKIKNVVNELNTYLLKGTKDKHVMIGLQKAVAEALDVVNMDTVGAEQRLAKLNEELVRAKTPEKIKEIMGKIQRVEAMGDKMSDRLNKLKTAYAEIKDSNDPLIANSHDEVIEASIESVAKSVGDTALRDMSLSQLEDVYDLYKMVLTRIRDANKTFANNKKESIDRLASNTQMEVELVGGKKKFGLKSFGAVNSFLWNNLKPVYAFKAIGSKTLTGLFDNVRSGEDTWARDVSEARAFYIGQSKKHGYDSWDLEKTYRFRSTSGMDFKLNLEQMMSLYAYSKRSQAEDHLKYGGIVLENSFERKNLFGKFSIKLKTEDATAYNISPETLSEIIGKLTSEQKAFVDQMQDYLSTTMGAKGNEVSLEMYGVKLFKEKFYFPLKSAQQYMAKAREQANGEVKIKNSGFTKETSPHAKNPIVLEGFMDVWANHVNDMSMYHAFTLPLEDFYRVYNYRTPSNNENMPTEGVNPAIENAYGKAATRYIEQLLKDLNGGARSDPTAGILNKMTGLFKKGAVFASASVVIQQPSAIARALALVDSKYFVGKKMDSKKHDALWEEVKKYAPVAIIKEMGYFDTNMGKSTVDFIKAKEYESWGEKMTALVKDSGYRDEVLSKAPALADELAWCQIWEAVKRETLDKTSLTPESEEFLKKAGERFTEVIVNTQVYDSVLSRSANMRSKDSGMEMATAFLAEPTTSINMIADALIQGKRGNRKYARSAIGAVIASQILNAILVSFVYAGRDDDEDETYWEKYIGSLTAEIKDSFNLFSYIPFVKDIVSIVQGYDVERSDISVISDLWKAWEQRSSDKLSTYRKVENFAGSIAQLLGLPVRNIMRDARGLYQTVNSFMNGQKTTGAGVKYAVMGAITNQTISDGQQLYEAMLNDDAAHVARVRSRFKDQSAVDSAIRKALRENDPRIHEAAVARYDGDIAEYTRIAKEIIAEGHFSQDYVVSAISTEMNTLDKDDSKSTSSSKVSGMYETSDFTAAIISGDSAMANAARSDIIRTAVSNGKTQKDAESYFSSSAASALKKKYMDGEITEAKAVQALVDYCGKDQESAEERVDEWAFESEHGFAYSDRGDAYMSGEISASELRNILISYGRKSPEEADIQIEVYDWQNEGYEYVTADRVSDYAEHCEGLGIPKDIYLEIRYIQSNTHNDVDANGNTINYSAMKKIMEVINSYDLTPAQKDAVARSIGWSEKNIKKYKLW